MLIGKFLRQDWPLGELARKHTCASLDEEADVGPKDNGPPDLECARARADYGGRRWDPSGIATYSQAGAQFGFALTWIRARASAGRSAVRSA